ncbi:MULTISPECIES: hypothetical protein [unclassified Bradyrhizobium]|uniref:hypothetical protein n=1 Tax=unclassified Bradyrhizobium TaxID=2631580 RepID=UPI002916D627|nr:MULTISPECIES: hypothetical protein [unclassified Bradyrhizobium]
MTDLRDIKAPAYVIVVYGTDADPHDRSFKVRGPDPIASKAAVQMLWPGRNVDIDHNLGEIDIHGMEPGEIREYARLD